MPTSVHFFHGDSNELGAACGWYYRIGCLSITDLGDSDMIHVVAGAE